MQARLSALRMHEQRSAGWYLFSIIACSGLSAFGNLAMSLQDFQPGSLNHAGSLIQHVSPWLGVAFPLLIILISIASDKVLDVDPTEHLDVEAYRKLEQRRIAILVERNNFLEQQVEQDRRREDIKRREKGSKRHKRGPSPETTPPSPRELEPVMARLEALQEQVQQLSVASLALVHEQQGQAMAPPPSESALMHLLGEQVIHQQQELGPLTPALVSQVFTRLVPSTHNGHLTHALVNGSVNTVSDTDVDTIRSGEETANGHHAETIAITHWRSEGVESEQATGQTGEAAQASMRPRTEQQTRPMVDEPRSIRRAADASDGKQETHQPTEGMGNGEVFPDRASEERCSVHEEDPRPSVYGHLEGQDRDPPVNTPPGTAVNSTASTGTRHTGNSEQTAREQSSEQLTEHPGEQEERAEAPLKVNSAVNMQAPTFPSTRVNSQTHTLVTIPTGSRANTATRGTRRSGKGQGRADKPRGEASQRVRRVLKKDPTLSITRLSEKANVSRGYASQVRAQVLSEHQRDPSPSA